MKSTIDCILKGGTLPFSFLKLEAKVNLKYPGKGFGFARGVSRCRFDPTVNDLSDHHRERLFG